MKKILRGRIQKYAFDFVAVGINRLMEQAVVGAEYPKARLFDALTTRKPTKRKR